MPPSPSPPNGRPPGAPPAGEPWPVDERRPVTREISCGRCGAVVLAAKFSPEQTSVQWTPDAVRACAEFAARVAAGEQTALIDGCASLRASIDAAVLAGDLPVVSPVPEVAAPPEAVSR